MVKEYGFYEYQLIILTTCCIGAFILQQYAVPQKQAPTTATAQHRDEQNTEHSRAMEETHRYRRLMGIYLLVYGMVMFADWLQGPYIYSLYNEQYGFPERIVAILFVTGFTSGGFTAPLVGVWADQYGRRRLCQIFCLTYTISCICTLFPSFPILFFGRFLGGLSTSILFSCFESWLMASSTSLGLTDSELSKIMGRATFLNGFVAASAGVLTNSLVARTKNFQTPFIASGTMLTLAWLVIKCLWSENYGTSTSETDIFQVQRLKTAWSIVKNDASLLSLVITQTCFEGSMYLFVFLWVPSLQEFANGPLPLGNIFASYMVSMMLGSLIYTSIISITSFSYVSSTDSSLALHAKLSSMVCIVAASCFVTSVITLDPRYRFYAFCTFEACVGMYYPVQGMLRSSIISDEHRATLSALSRVPLNIFVTAALLTGVSKARAVVFNSCAIVLFIAAVMTAAVISRRARVPPSSQVHRNE